LTDEEQKTLFLYCQKKKIIFLSTPYDEKSADSLEKLGVLAFKIGSGELNHIPLLKHVAKKGIPMIISTGGAYLKEVKEAISAIKKEGNNKIVLLHCTSLYPAPLKDVNLKAMLTLKKEFSLPVGYSDHTRGISISLAAVALGASVIEKHFTLSRNLSGPDHKASSEPREFKEMVRAIRDTEKALGSPVKKPVLAEKEERKLGWRSIVAKADIPKGKKIVKSMLVIKRPGTGIKPKDLGKIIGKKAKRDIKSDSILTRDDA
jgi:sialic acid synthase SpsE